MIQSILTFFKNSLIKAYRKIKLPSIKRAQQTITKYEVTSLANQLNMLRYMRYGRKMPGNTNFITAFVSRKIHKFKSAFTLNSLLSTIISLIGFLYRVFIFVQMCCLGYGESIRIRRYISYILLNCKKIKINPMK